MGEAVGEVTVETGETVWRGLAISALASSRMVSMVTWRGVPEVSSASASAGEGKVDATEPDVREEQEIGEARTGLLDMNDEGIVPDSPTKLPGNLSLG